MQITANIIVFFVAVQHLVFLILEMFLWDKPIGLKIFRNTLKTASSSKVLAANQGLYNGFLAAGLFWGGLLGSSGTHIKIFFLSCVVIAGIFGSATVSRKILYVQAVPAAIGLVFVWLS